MISRSLHTLLRTSLVVAIATFAVACSNSATTEGEHETAAKSSSAGLPTGDIMRGEKRALVKSVATGQTCIDCHGAEGNKPIDPTYPMLGGQYGDYLAYTLTTYRDGKRKGSSTTDLMAQQAKDLSDQDIADLAAYFASRQTHLRDLSHIKVSK